ncbi:MAG: FG-GAP-like repeat-containing protein [Casimicrobiaceae bacterium]
MIAKPVVHKTLTRIRSAVRVALPALVLSIAASSLPALAHETDVRANPARGGLAQSVTGIVRALDVIDRAGGTVTRLRALTPAGAARIELRGAAADALESGDTTTVDGTRSGDTLSITTVRVVAKAAPAATAISPVEQVGGTLRVIHSEDLERGTSRYDYEVVQDDGTTVELDLGVRADMLRPGMRVVATGRRDPGAGAVLIADSLEILAQPPAQVMQKDGIAAVTSHSVLVVLFKFKNSASDPFPVSTAQTIMTSGATNVATYYAENSFGQHTLNVTVTTTWVQSTTLSAPTTCNNSDWQGIGNAADAAAAAAGYTGSYEFRVYVFPKVSACGWTGLGYINSPRKSYINGSMSTLVVAHEMGHNFGLLHAASLDCGAAPIGGTCSASAYGDPFDVMGNQRAMHFNAAQKSKLGWLPTGSVKTHASGAATYTLSPLESLGGAAYAVKIPVTANRTYWLEYRQPVGADSPLSAYPNNGAQIRVASPFETNCSGCADDTQFLDLTPSTSAFTDGTLIAGSRFRDDISGLTINVLAASPAALTVSVGFTDDVPAPDFNASGTTDLVWSNAATGATQLWLMSGATSQASATLLTNVDWSVVASGDFNGDGKADLVWHNAVTGNTSMWLMNGTAMVSGAPLLADPNWRVIRTADFNGDGKADLLWQNDASGATAIWLMNGSAYAGGAVLLTDPDWRVTHVGDFDGDGKADLVWRNNATGATALWLMNGTTYKSGAILLTDANWRVTHVADLDGDGKADLLWRNSATGTTSAWLMNGIAMGSGKTLLVDGNTRVVATGDFDNDGKKDLVWRNTVSGTTSVWLMNGTTTKSSATVFSDLLTNVTHVGDFDGDGRADLILRNDTTGATDLWLMSGMAHVGGATLQTSGNWRVVNPLP